MIFYKLFFVLCLFFSCNKENYVKTYTLPKNKPILNIPNNKEEIEIPFSWTIPESWSVGNPSSMRLATYSASYPKGVADVSITNFSGDGGGILANVNRWRRQLNLEPQSLDEINNLMLSETSGLGEYKYIKIVNYEEQSSAFLCAILAIKNSTLFIKLNASLEGINYLEQEFVSFCSSFK